VRNVFGAQLVRVAAVIPMKRTARENIRVSVIVFCEVNGRNSSRQ
jgi:hypothetical protein